ncbi:thioredoxin-dependent thiol peroxidase [Shewanella sp. C32]|uniref:thioredoxin-dependent peroxiredoxin n=1 Tax=Shewanella electrica TaxID=515560 RepID=A0ABT2FL54_9GAMM|nr:thioredoxin-dependent thiol peroxidase [Shewanella electrica]MCH1923848.1 thioredoxin-dependent thiol peroxidase [Shewanella electrica]MCS4557067.1 thioredoxin-dependent thiol peroxidase [Shewanella electrica]
MTPLTEGQQAPAFTLKNQNGEDVSLSETLKSQRVLVYFYPKAMTPGCTVQACGLRDTYAELAKRGVTVFGISPDAPAKLKKFEDKYELNFTLLSDEDHQVAEAFGVWGEKKFMGKVYDGIHRLSFLVGQDGKVEKFFDKFKTKDHHEVVLAYLDQQA